QAMLALDGLKCDFVGGRVFPIWQKGRPEWVSESPSKLWAVLALLDYGTEPIEFGQKYVPLGVNMAFHRRCFEIAGLWDNRLGRKAGTLLGQEVREWCIRARAAGLKGFYAPELVIDHCIPSSRLTRSTFAAGIIGMGSAARFSTSGPGWTWRRPRQQVLTSRRYLI